MIVDTGVGSNDKLNLFMERDASSNYSDTHGHGTHIAGLIALGDRLNEGVCKQVKIYSCKFYEEHDTPRKNVERTIQCLKTALTMNIDLVNYSAGGSEVEPDEFDMYDSLVKTGTIVNVAAGNGREDGMGHDLKTESYYPACYAIRKYKDRGPINHMNVIENMCRDGKLCRSSNFYAGLRSEIGDQVLSTLPGNRLGRMTGTSQATAIFTHKMLIQKCNEMNKGVVYGKR